VNLAGLAILWRPVAASLFAAAFIATPQVHNSGDLGDLTSCASNIVSSTVVATYCDHRIGDDRILDLFILWRGHPGWIEPRSATSGSRTIGGGTKGKIADSSTYGRVTISYDADFDANTVKIGDQVVSLAGVNTVLVDGVDDAGPRLPLATRWSEPRLPLTTPDPNVTVVERSPELVAYLQCGIPMPARSSTSRSEPRLPVITVCEKLR
jgi:hypothetical protein